MNPHLLFWHRLCIASYCTLLLVIGVWYLFADRPQHIITWLVLAMYLGLLALPAADLFRKRPRVYMWSSYLMLIYFSHGIIESWANQADRLFALAELFLSCVYFVAATMCVRYARQASDHSSMTRDSMPGE